MKHCGSARCSCYSPTPRKSHQSGATPVPVNPNLVKFGLIGQQSGYTLVRQLLDALPRPEAVFIANSRLAIGALRALTAAGLRLPQDIAVASFYDIPALDDDSPFMATVTQPAYDIGRIGVRRLLGRIAGKHDRMEEIILPHRRLAK